MLIQSHKKQHSLDIWTIKLLFLLIYENVEKHCNGLQWVHDKTQKQGKLYNTDYIVPDLSDLFVDEKQSKCRLKKEIFVFVKSIVLTKNWFLASNFWEFTNHHTEN